jgi:hypothetical protein
MNKLRAASFDIAEIARAATRQTVVASGSFAPRQWLIIAARVVSARGNRRQAWLPHCSLRMRASRPLRVAMVSMFDPEMSLLNRTALWLARTNN